MEQVILHKKEKAVSYNKERKEIYFHKFTFNIDELRHIVNIVECEEKENENG
tara:strand:- start:540 stop:695 length:156 start_codon:yes stop_codon:yes gene_type:complete